MRIPVLDLSAQIEAHWEEFNQAIQGVLKSAQFINGPNVKALEGEIARYLGVRHAVGCNSGTDALVIGLKAAGVDAGDEVITTAFSFFATSEAIHNVGATPIYVDISPKTFNLDPRLVEKAITPKTRAIIPVHLYGQPAEMGPIMDLAQRHGLKVIEDVAQAFGASYQGRKVGTIGHVGAFSFFPSKNLAAFGDGGIMATDDDKIAEMCRMLRAHGSKKKYFNEVIGYNSRLDEMQAAIVRVKLPHIDRWNEARRRVAGRYRELLSGCGWLELPEESRPGEHVYHQFTVRIRDGKRDVVSATLKEKGVETMVYYPIPLHALPIYPAPLNHLPNAERACSEVLSLPIWPEMSEETQRLVVDAVRQCHAC